MLNLRCIYMKSYRHRSCFYRCLAVAFFSLLTLGRAAVFSVDENTLHVWNFASADASALTDIKAGLELNPALRSATLRWSKSPRGGALVFPGDLRLQTTKGESPAPVERAITVECWLRIEGAPGRIVGVVEHLDYTTKAGYRLALGPEGQVRWVVMDSTTEQVSASKKRIVAGEWTHVAATYNGQTMSIYINGVLDSRKPLAAGVPDAPGRPLVVGFYANASAQGFFKGEMEGLRFSKAAKTAFPLE